MKIQSLSVSVPGGCVNRCKFCVSRMHTETYINNIDKNNNLYENDYIKRLSFARDNGCNTVIITGAGEPLINKKFIERFFKWNNLLNSPFRWIEIQTSGATLDDDYLSFLRLGGVNTISLSLSSVFDNLENAKYNDPLKQEYIININDLCKKIKENGFNLRLSLNMTDWYNNKTSEEIFKRLKDLDADQVTFRVLYKSNMNCEQDKWIDQHNCSSKIIADINNYIKKNGKILEVLPFGAMKYSVDGISTVVDDDCMSRENNKEVLKYLVLRQDCKLYSKWDDKGSLIF